MKKKIISLLLLISLSLTACVNINYTETNTTQEEVKAENVEENVESKQEDAAQTTIEQQNDINVYYPDEMAESAIVEVISTYDELTEELLWDLLKEKSVIIEECQINSFVQNGTSLELDVNEAFGIQLRSYGTAGEKMMIHCVVNTFLDAFQGEEIKITENGEILCSGHIEYDGYLTKYE